MAQLKKIITFLKQHQLTLATAESCTAGRIIDLLASIRGSGECLEVGFIVYSEKAKKNLLRVRAETIERYTLTSEEVVREMVIGAFRRSSADVVLATTGLAGPDPIDGIPPGTICFGWGFKQKREINVLTATKKFSGTRAKVQHRAAVYALECLPHYYEKVNKA